MPSHHAVLLERVGGKFERDRQTEATKADLVVASAGSQRGVTGAADEEFGGGAAASRAYFLAAKSKAPSKPKAVGTKVCQQRRQKRIGNSIRVEQFLGKSGYPIAKTTEKHPKTNYKKYRDGFRFLPFLPYPFDGIFHIRKQQQEEQQQYHGQR